MSSLCGCSFLGCEQRKEVPSSSFRHHNGAQQVAKGRWPGGQCRMKLESVTGERCVVSAVQRVMAG